MSKKNEHKNFTDIEVDLLKQEIEILQEEKCLERERVLKDIAKKLLERNMAFPIIRDIVELPEEELRDIFYGST